MNTAALKELAQNATDKPRLINAWATWCGPCVTEFPDLVKIHRMYRGRGLEVVTVSADFPDNKESALKFLKGQQASTRNVILDSEDSYALIDALDKEWPGALPYTILVAPGGKVLYRSQGAFDALKLKKAIVGYFGRYYHSVAGAAAGRSTGDAPRARHLGELSSDQWRSGLAAWLGWFFDGLDMHLYTLVAAPFVMELLGRLVSRGRGGPRPQLLDPGGASSSAGRWAEASSAASETASGGAAPSA